MWPVKDVSSTEMYTLELWQKKDSRFEPRIHLDFFITWIIIDVCRLGSIGPEPLRLVLHEAEVPWQSISAMIPGLSRADALSITECLWLFATGMVTCSKRFSSLCQVELGCQNLMRHQSPLESWQDAFPSISPKPWWGSWACHVITRLEYLSLMNSMTWMTTSVFFLSHSCLPSKFPTQSSGLGQLQCFVSPRKFCVWAHPHPSINVEHLHSSQRLPPWETVGPGKLARRTANAWVWKQFVEHCWDSMNCYNSSKHSLWGVNRCQRRAQSHAKGQQK